MPKTAYSSGNRAERKLATTDWQAGMAKNQLIFIIICSVAVAVAAITVVYTLTGSSSENSGDWQCLQCGYEFSKAKKAEPPINCPKCDGEAVVLEFRDCPECGEKNVISRVRLPKQGEEAVAQPVGGGPEFGPLPTVQYRVKQSDGTYTWTDWMPITASELPLHPYMICTKCGANLFGQPAN